MAEMRVGQLAGAEERFCPVSAVSKWPYKYLYGKDSEEVSKTFFAYGEFRNRGWTIYYIRTLLETHPKPLFLIPKSEVHALFVEIFEDIGVHADFPDACRHPGFDIGFEEEGSPRPRYIGRLTNDCGLDELEKMIPEEGSTSEESQDVEDRSFPAFRRKMDAAILAGKAKNKAVKEKKRRDRVNVRREWCASLKRTQCYLGIRPRGIADKEHFHADPNHTWEQSQATEAAYKEAAGLGLPELIPTNAAPYPFHQNVVFVCVDIEAYEMDQKVITEIGISTLDTSDLNNVPPGEGGAGWMKKIRARHFRIAEYAHLHNHVYVAGCAGRFLGRFGKSEWISINNASQVVASCFRHPFSAPGQYTPFTSELKMMGRYGFDKQLLSQYLPPIDHTQKRKVILVGHDIKSDIEYLRTIGYDVTNLPNLLETVDTATLYKAMKHAAMTPSLATILLELGMTGWHLHNAGNDAGYTLEALIGLAITALTYSHNPAPDPETLDAAAAEAQARLIEEQEDWEMADEEGGDGGSAVPLPSISESRAQEVSAASMRFANKAEPKAHQKYNKSNRGSASNPYKANYEADFPSLKNNSKNPTKTSYRAPYDKKTRGKPQTSTLDPRAKKYTPPRAADKPQSTTASGKQPLANDDDLLDLDDDADGGVPLTSKTRTRLAQLRVDDYDDDDDYFKI